MESSRGVKASECTSFSIHSCGNTIMNFQMNDFSTNFSANSEGNDTPIL